MIQRPALAAIAVLAGMFQAASAQDEGAATEPGQPHGHGYQDLQWNLAPYVGVTFEANRFQDWDFTRYIDSQSFVTSSTRESDSGYRLHAGMDFLKYFGAELTYANAGEASFVGQSDGSGSSWGTGPQSEVLELTALGVDFHGRYPLSERVSVGAKAGWWRWKAEKQFDGSTASGPYSSTESDASTKLAYGVGLVFDTFAPTRITLEYNIADFDTLNAFGNKAELRSVGFSLRYFIGQGD